MLELTREQGLTVAHLVGVPLAMGVAGILSALAVEDATTRAQTAVGALTQLVPLVLIAAVTGLIIALLAVVTVIQRIMFVSKQARSEVKR